MWPIFQPCLNEMVFTPVQTVTGMATTFPDGSDFSRQYCSGFHNFGKNRRFCIAMTTILD